MQKVDIAMRIHQQAGVPLDEAAKVLDWFVGFLKTLLRQANRSASTSLVSLQSEISALAQDGILERAKRS